MSPIPADINPNSAFYRHVTVHQKSRVYGTVEVDPANETSLVFHSSDTECITVLKETNTSTSAKVDALWYKAAEKLNSYRNLQEGWDLYFAKKIDPLSIELAEGFIEVFALDSKSNFLEVKKLFVAPGSDGTVGIEIQANQKTVLMDIDVEANEITLHKTDTGDQPEESYPLNEFDMGKISQWLAS